MYQASNEYMGVTLNIWTYRHFAVAVTKKYVKELAQFFAADEEWQKSEKAQGRYLGLAGWALDGN
jgi:hypothetical protein